MIFHEKLNLKFDVNAMREEMSSMYELGPRVTQGEVGEFGGWSLQTDDGDWRRGFEQGGYYENESNERFTYGQARPTHEYNKPTAACIGIFSDIINELEEKGFHPHRTRITALDPGQSTSWHLDGKENEYAVRLHIPITTNPNCYFEVRNEGIVHMPADGHAHVVDVATMHQARNEGTTSRIHFLAQVWVTQGYSEHFVVTESRKNISSYYNMMGYYTYLKMLDEQAKG